MDHPFASLFAHRQCLCRRHQESVESVRHDEDSGREGSAREQVEHKGYRRAQGKGLAAARLSSIILTCRGEQFWKTQPVPQTLVQRMQSAAGGSSAHIIEDIEEGPIDDPKTVDEVRKEPLALPNGYEWHTIDINNASDVSFANLILQLTSLTNGISAKRSRPCYPKTMWRMKMHRSGSTTPRSSCDGEHHYR